MTRHGTVRRVKRQFKQSVEILWFDKFAWNKQSAWWIFSCGCRKALGQSLSPAASAAMVGGC